MKIKSNYILPDDDVQGQQSFKGLENTVRVAPVEPVQIKEPFKPDFKLGWRQLDKLQKEYRYQKYIDIQIDRHINETSKPVDCSILGVKSKLFEENLSKLLKKIKE